MANNERFERRKKVKKTINLESYVDPLKQYFISNKNKKLKEAQIARHLKLKNNQMRWVIAQLRYQMPILLVEEKTYLFTNKKELLEKEYERLNAIVKQKAIKKNVIKREINKLKGAE